MSSPSKAAEPGSHALLIDDLIDVACDEFEEALRAGQETNLGQFLERVDESQRSRLFCELLYVEFEHRPPPADDDPREFYLKKYPSFADEIRGMSFTTDMKDTVYYSPSSPGSEARPRSFSRFRLEESLGVGAMGEVWKAYDPRLDRYVAVKFPRNTFPSDDDLRRFLREGRAAAQLRHPNLVQVHEVAHEGGAIYIVSDYIEGGDLRAYLASTHLTYREAAELCATIASALHYAHNRGIVHRDLKPANVLMDEEKRPHIMDFGIAKWASDAEAMTTTGDVLGTPAYMSPEQACGHAADVDRRSDVYSVGVMLYEMITGRVPFSGDLMEILRAIADDPPKEPRSIRRDIPRDLATICMKAMEKDPARRYETALELAQDLQRFLAGESIVARPVGLAEKSWRWCKRRPAVAASLFLTAVVIAAGWTAYREREEARRAADIRTVVLNTVPSGAEVVFVPLNDRTGLPEPGRLLRAGRSPVKLGLAPGDYLVVAAHANGMFHEVHRHVPRSDEGLAGGLDTEFYRVEQGGGILLPLVKLWANSKIRGMRSVEISSPLSGRREELLVDEREMVAGDLDPTAPLRRQLAPTEPILVDFDSALNYAEVRGKRLPTAPEFERILDAFESQDQNSPPGLFTEPWEWTSSATATSLLVQGYTGPALTEEQQNLPSAELSGTVMVFGGSRLRQGRSVVKYGGSDATAALRAVRSVRPRLHAENFLSFEQATDTTVSPSRTRPGLEQGRGEDAMSYP